MNKALKIMACVMAFLLVSPLVVALFLPKTFTIEQETVVNKPKAQVFDYCKHLKNQEDYNVWLKADPNVKTSYRGKDGNVGSVLAWESQIKDVGRGEQEIKKITDGERIDTELRFKEPFEATNQTWTTFEPVGENQTKLKAGFTGTTPYPMNLMMFFCKDKLKADMGKNIANIKGCVEK